VPRDVARQISGDPVGQARPEAEVDITDLVAHALHEASFLQHVDRDIVTRDQGIRHSDPAADARDKVAAAIGTRTQCHVASEC
jgi:hypothetical protein